MIYHNLESQTEMSLIKSPESKFQMWTSEGKIGAKLWRRFHGNQKHIKLMERLWKNLLLSKLTKEREREIKLKGRQFKEQKMKSA